MSENTISHLPDPFGFSSDPLSDVLRAGARHLIKQAVEAELIALLSAHADDKTEDGRARLVRHGHLPERAVMTGIGPVPVKVPRVRDRRVRVLILAAAIMNGCFSRSAAATRMMRSRRFSCCERTQRENRIHRLGSKLTLPPARNKPTAPAIVGPPSLLCAPQLAFTKS